MGASLTKCLPAPDYIPYTVADPLPNCVIVFDNKGGGDDKPRLGVARAGGVDIVVAGDSTVLGAHDLESISLVDASRGLYVAATSLGEMHTFILQQSTEGGFAGNDFLAKHVAKGQLPVPEDESTGSWRDANRTNIEAMRFVKFGTSAHFPSKSGTILWGARGGNGYAGKEGGSPTVWLRHAPFDAETCTVDMSQLVETTLPNLGENSAWRALSSMDVSGSLLYFASAFDGEEEGHELQVGDDKRQSAANQTAFKSLVACQHLGTGKITVLSKLSGVKLEGLCVLDKSVTPTSAANATYADCTQLLLCTDDEALGCLMGKLYVTDGSVLRTPPPIFRDFSEGASLRYPKVAGKRWGSSGVALLATVAMAPSA